MKPTHALAIAAVLAVAAVLGLAAVTRTSSLGASTKQASAATLASRAHKLDSFEASLQKALKSKPPALPKMPAAGAATPVATAPRVIYQRPAPIIVHTRSHHGDDDNGYESEHEGTGGGEHDD